MMTFLDIAARNERDHAEALALREEQLLIMAAYRDQLEDKADIAIEMIARDWDCSKDEAQRMIDDAYEVLQVARKAAT